MRGDGCPFENQREGVPDKGNNGKIGEVFLLPHKVESKEDDGEMVHSHLLNLNERKRRRKAMQDNKTAFYLSATSERFQQLFSDLEAVVRRTFPHAEATFEYDMPGWKIPIPGAERPLKGTIDPNSISILLVERKGGITLHLSHPLNYSYLDAHKEELSQAGFKVMRGCLQFHRKTVYPLGAVEKLLQALQWPSAG